MNGESLYGASSVMDGTFQMWCEPQHGIPLNTWSLKKVSWLDLVEEGRQEVITVWENPLQCFAPGAPTEQETFIAVASSGSGSVVSVLWTL
ncbi:hypothetical protein ACFZFR_003710 [Salmonella enterica]